MQRALLSVSDKSGLIPFARALVAAGIEIISTGGTAKALREESVSVTDLSAYTGFPEMLDGRVKTLHPKVHGGLLFVRSNAAHKEAVLEHGIKPIDLVVVNLYPFEKTVARQGVNLDEAVENIDIGGPSMLRSAAKNYESVTVVVDPDDYCEIAREIEVNGNTVLATRQRLAAKVFRRTAAYDRSIGEFLSDRFGNPETATGGEQQPSELASELVVRETRAQPLRYGENPHQKAALYGAFNRFYQQLHGKELSYNNILDLTAAAHLIGEFSEDAPTLAILKHTNPCGVGQGADLREAWEKAYATDKQAPFGGIIAVNSVLDEACALAIAEIFSEVIVAPGFSPEGLAVLQKKKNLRLMKVIGNPREAGARDIRSVGADSYLMQESDRCSIRTADLKIVTKRKPAETELQAMVFGWRVVKHIKSNAIVYVQADRTLGVGAGQMSRVDASRIAVWKAGESALSLKGSVVCSDAFFPFPDGLIAAAEAGATAAIQPGGSVRDNEVIAAADERGVAMAFTGVRHFRH